MQNVYKETSEDIGSSQYRRRHNYVHSEAVIDRIVYNINSVFDMTSKTTAEDKLKFLLKNAAEKMSF
ncbi:MAG: hypothetical protein NC247_14355 [Ruminococcus flavefaciens]|nr:hypothetical protein [Ruminococcus flavefaciens]